MRRLPRLRTAAPAGFVPSSIPSGSLRAPAAAVLGTASTLPQTTPRLNKRPTQSRRYLSTTPIRLSQAQSQSQTEAQPQQPESVAEEIEELPEEYYTPEPTQIQTQLVYPDGLTTAPSSSDVTDPSYTPADTAEGLEEVGGLGDWWENPAHWGSEGGVAEFVRSVTQRFGPAEKVTDPAMLEVLAKRAIVEAMVVAQFGGIRQSKKVDRLFARPEETDWLGKVVPVRIVAGEDGVATLKDKDLTRVWGVLKGAAKANQPEQQQGEKEVAEEGSEAVEAEASQETEASQEVTAPEADVKEAASPRELTPEVARRLVKAWNKKNKEWKKAELRDPVVKFFAAKRIQQLTGHRIPDGKLVAIGSIENLLKELVEPEKPKKLAELIETKGVFKDLPNVRVFPRRITPIDKEKMVGRWKIIVKELEKRELPVIGTGDYGPPVEKKWIEGRA